MTILTPAAPRAGFGLPEADGLLHVRSCETVGLGAIRTTLTQSYYFQSIGQTGRNHRFLSRLGMAFGLGEMGQVYSDLRYHGVARFAYQNDPDLYRIFGESNWEAGVGDIDLGGKLILPVPIPRLTLALDGTVRMPTGDSARHLTSGYRDVELMGVLSFNLLSGERFLPTTIHLNWGHRFNRNPDGFGLSPNLAPHVWSAPWPPFYPSLEDGDRERAQEQVLYGVGLEFFGKGKRIYGELTFEDLPYLRDRIKLQELPLQLGLGFRYDGPWNLEFSGSVDMNISRDHFDTDFEPHYPRTTFTAGVSKRWQVLAGDPDGDGIRGADDRCPDHPEDFDGFEDGDGCPDPDNDRDGVPDIIDLAPDLPEDIDGFDDRDGRPDLDNDNDSIPDRIDLCPDRAEDFDGFEDDDGCPERGEAPAAEPDSDGGATDPESTVDLDEGVAPAQQPDDQSGGGEEAPAVIDGSAVGDNETPAANDEGADAAAGTDDESSTP